MGGLSRLLCSKCAACNLVEWYILEFMGRAVRRATTRTLTHGLVPYLWGLGKLVAAALAALAPATGQAFVDFTRSHQDRDTHLHVRVRMTGSGLLLQPALEAMVGVARARLR